MKNILTVVKENKKVIIKAAIAVAGLIAVAAWKVNSNTDDAEGTGSEVTEDNGEEQSEE